VPFVATVGGVAVVMVAEPPVPMYVTFLPASTVSLDEAASVADYAPAPPPAAVNFNGQLFVYPANGQSSAQLSDDRYQCHQAAVSQSGFDPTRSGGGSGLRDEYWADLASCLEGRGYTTSYPHADGYQAQDPGPAEAPVDAGGEEPPPPGESPPSEEPPAPPVAAQMRTCRYVRMQAAAGSDSDQVRELYCENGQGDWEPAQSAVASN
jgi:hypothetical protein